MTFATLGHRGGPDASGGVCTSLTEEVEGQHARCHFESVRPLKGARAGRDPIHVQSVQLLSHVHLFVTP